MNSATPSIKLTDPTLFGNDAAEDEADAIFNSYVLERDEVQRFVDPSYRIQIARAYKGEGKSALLRLARDRISSTQRDDIVISATGASISPDRQDLDTDHWVRDWKKTLFGLIANEIGARLGAAWSDDAMSLVQEAELNGFRSRSIVGSILDRLNIQQLPITERKTRAANTEKLVERWAHRQVPVWLFIDDVDQNFEDTPQARAKAASFFIACRHLHNQVPQLQLRAAVRPNVWTTIKLQYEALSHVEQYCVDLTWDVPSLRKLLGRRVEAQLERAGSHKTFLANLPRSGEFRDEKLISLVFEEEMPWGYKQTRPPHVVLTTLARRRPRWLIELSKVAANAAERAGASRVSIQHIRSTLADFGRRRIEDTNSEFRPQCPQVGEIIAAFADQQEQYTTDQLITTIKNRVLQALSPQIAGGSGKTRPIDVAQFLFRIGFLTARREVENGYEHVTYADNPTLFSVRTNIDQGHSWEIHPVFRQALGLRDESGREVHRRGGT